ncbi:uncharacterized protein LOC126577491 [Anopheles aquasalis]|uniref:uncharacterized protein LOC126577491 n=1 Tax=Anopheles aquasalis TaxID=42839 RepID=UPI00215A7D62|nr:uncharacterized protein LOC126577491 [Anopheles aquasalis]
MGIIAPIRYITLLLLAFNCLSLDGLFTLVAVTKKMDLKNNYKYINVTATLNEIGPIANHSIDVEIEVLKELRVVKLYGYYHLVLNGSVVPNAFFRRTVDICHFLKRPTSDRLYNLLYVRLKQNNRLAERCPMPPGHYYIRGFRPSSVEIPGFLPENDFLLKQVYQIGINNEPLVVHNFYGRFVRLTSD